jgi:hypothetical protein
MSRTQRKREASTARPRRAATTFGLLACVLSALVVTTSLAQSSPPPNQRISPQQRIGAPQLQDKAHWYQQSFRKFDPAVFNAPSRVIVSRSSDLGRSEVVENFNPVKASRNSGQPGVIQRDNSVCDVQPMTLDYLQQERFKLFDRRPMTIFPGSFVNLQTLLNPTPQFYAAPNRRDYEVIMDISRIDDAGQGGVRPQLPGRIATAVPQAANLPVTRVTGNFSQDPTDTTLHPSLRNRQLGAPIPQTLFVSTREVRSDIEARASLDAAVGILVPLAEFGIPLDISNRVQGSAEGRLERRVRTHVIQIEHPMYAYRMTENDRNALFTVPGEAAKHQNAAVVESVVFGRRLLIVVTSTLDAASAEAVVRQRLGVSFTGGELAGAALGSQLDARAEASFRQEILTFAARVFGGSSAYQNTTITDPEFARQYLLDPSAQTLSRETREVPIAYSLQKLSAGNVMIGVRSLGNFNDENCVQPVYKVDVGVKGIKAYKVVEAPGDDKEDIFGSATVFRSGAPNTQRQRVISIPENQAISIRANETAGITERKMIADNVTLSQLREMFVEWAPDLYDWELLQKPQFRVRQPADLRIEMRPRLNQIVTLRQGAEARIDNRVMELRLYENGDRNAASIAILYEIFVQRK